MVQGQRFRVSGLGFPGLGLRAWNAQGTEKKLKLLFYLGEVFLTSGGTWGNEINIETTESTNACCAG